MTNNDAIAHGGAAYCSLTAMAQLLNTIGVRPTAAYWQDFEPNDQKDARTTRNEKYTHA